MTMTTVETQGQVEEGEAFVAVTDEAAHESHLRHVFGAVGHVAGAAVEVAFGAINFASDHGMGQVSHASEVSVSHATSARRNHDTGYFMPVPYSSSSVHHQ